VKIIPVRGPAVRAVGTGRAGPAGVRGHFT